jgi:hypothetical protein
MSPPQEAELRIIKFKFLNYMEIKKPWKNNRNEPEWTHVTWYRQVSIQETHFIPIQNTV